MAGRQATHLAMQILALMQKLSGSGNIVSQADHAIIEHKDSIGWDIIIRMELLTPLPEYLREAALSRDEIIKIGIDLCKALEICQRYNIIHRDIKPSNIFVSESGLSSWVILVLRVWGKQA